MNTLRGDPSGIARERAVHGVNPVQPQYDKCLRGRRGKEVGGKEIREWLRARWDDGTGVGLLEGEDPVQGTVRRLPERPQRDRGNTFSRARTLDLMASYAYLQKRYFDESRAYLRQIGCKVPVVAGNWSELSLPGLKTLENMDVADAHLYFDIPLPQTREGKYRNHNMFETYGLRNNETILASNALRGKPFSVSETGWCYPNEYQCQFLPSLTAYASLQDWDDMILFRHAPKPGDGIGNGSYPDDSFEMNPLIMTQAFIAGRVFRDHLVQKADETVLCNYDPKTVQDSYPGSLTGHGVWPARPYPFGDLWNEGGGGSLPFEIALKHRVRKAFVDGPSSISLLGSGTENQRLTGERLAELMHLAEADAITSDTGEILSDKKRQLLLVDAPAYQTITGRLEGNMETGSRRLCVQMKAPRYASISLLALDKRPIDRSRRLLLSTVARVRNTGMQWDADKHYVKEWGKGPVLCENVPARVLMATGAGDANFKAWALDGGGRKKKRVGCTVKNRVLEMEVGGDETIWYLVERR